MVATAGFLAGVQNALAGGGSFITFPALLLAGLNPLAANMTSTIALFPSQITSGYAGRKLVADVGPLTFRQMLIISAIGGLFGAVLLLNTPPSFFARLVPWLVLFATSVFAWGSFRKTAARSQQHAALDPDPGAELHRGVRRLFRWRHRFPDAGRADHRRPASACRDRHQECWPWP
jgi:uncharacterized membrane protein YfcA